MRETMGAAGVDEIIQVTSDNMSVRKLNKNELSKTYLSIHKDCQEELDKMVKGYKRFVFSPISVVGDDFIKEDSVPADSTNLNVDKSGNLI